VPEIDGPRANEEQRNKERVTEAPVNGETKRREGRASAIEWNLSLAMGAAESKYVLLVV